MDAPQIYRVALESMVLPTGLRGIRALVKLLVRNRRHQYEELEFQVDPGTNITAIPLSVAQDYELSYPATAIEADARTAAGKVRMPVHPGQITVRIPGWQHRDFVWPCHFVDYPNEEPPPLLGLPGLLNDVFLFFDGTYALDAPYGWVVLQGRLAGLTESAAPVAVLS